VAEQKVKILVFDNRDDKLLSVQDMLLHLGYQVILAHDGEETLKKARDNTPNIILLDMLTSKAGDFEVTLCLWS
jgi:CheY-like chemotaxis protein